MANWTFLMAWNQFLFTEIKRAAWYHLDSFGLFLDARELRAIVCCWLGGLVGLLVSLICHMPDVVDLLPSSTVSPSLTTLRWVAVKVAIHPSSHSCPIDMRGPDCRWGKTWDVQDAWGKRGFRLISALWVACMILPSVRMTWGTLLIICLLLHGVFTLI